MADLMRQARGQVRPDSGRRSVSDWLADWLETEGGEGLPRTRRPGGGLQRDPALRRARERYVTDVDSRGFPEGRVVVSTAESRREVG